ncbi:glycosyltransferase family 61 protein [Leptolyngbya sp. FACHB-17]|uniref:glycosyltransferase family 61 protein n=1 Tax=unclassified Leptolyngbya TaxID=2650499 RepID=UPI0016804526|nr:glycosyltransferase family 61 protein [Leptolyngbya sp. FACHB-17]MBD2080453.1 glycosyltransferase family 61 protein [Leptolyngbya sp. FACHB-17]
MQNSKLSSNFNTIVRTLITNIPKLLPKLKRKLSEWSLGWFFSLLYAPSEVASIDQLDRVEVKHVHSELIEQPYAVYTITKGKLFTDRHVYIAVSCDRFLVPGASWQWKDGIILPPEQNPVLSKGTPRSISRFRKSVLSLLTGGSGNYNYYHWLYDVLPRIKLCESVIDIDEVDYLLVPDLRYRFQAETLNLLSLKNNLISSAKVQHLCAEQLIVTDHPNPNFANPPLWIINWVRETFLPKANLDLKFNQRVYIERGDSVNGRRLLNENQVFAFLEQQGFSRYRLSDLSVLEQICLFHQAEIIVGVHGAGFTNLTFCRSNTKVIELFSQEYTPKVYEQIAKHNQLVYTSLITDDIEASESPLTANFSISLASLREHLQRVMCESRS